MQVFTPARASLNHLIWEKKIKKGLSPTLLATKRSTTLELKVYFTQTSPVKPAGLPGRRAVGEKPPSSPSRRVPDAPAWPRARLSPPSQTRTASSAAPSPGGSWRHSESPGRWIPAGGSPATGSQRTVPSPARVILQRRRRTTPKRGGDACPEATAYQRRILGVVVRLWVYRARSCSCVIPK